MNKNINDILNRLEFSFLISIIVALTALWYYFYNLIINNLLPPLIIIHYLTTVYLIMTVILCFMKGLHVVKSENEKNIFQQNLIRIYFYSWLPTIVISTILFCTSILSDDASFQLCILIILAVVGGFLFYKRKSIAKFWKMYLIVGIIFIPMFFVFIFSVSMMSMSVEINTDKKIYEKEDIIYVTLETKGYLFGPIICDLSGGRDNSKIKSRPDGQTWMIPTSEIDGLDGIVLKYRHRYLSQEKWKYHQIHIKP